MEDQRLPLHQMRASDAERDLTVDHLTTAFVDGRLGHGEYDRRVGMALGAARIGELRSLTADIPPPPEPDTGPKFNHERSSGGSLAVLAVPWREWGEEWRYWLGVAVVLTGVWGVFSLMGGEVVPYWPLVPLGIWASVLLASAIWPGGEEPP